MNINRFFKVVRQYAGLAQTERRSYAEPVTKVTQMLLLDVGTALTPENTEAAARAFVADVLQREYGTVDAQFDVSVVDTMEVQNAFPAG